MKDNSQALSTTDNTVNYDYNFGNYDPKDVEVTETINVMFVVDTSSSVFSYGDELNNAINEVVTRLQKSHAAPNLFVSLTEFNSDVTVTNGFRPIADMQAVDFKPRIGGATALYKACAAALQNALTYRSDLEKSGINCKTLLFVITDGEDNSSNPVVAGDVKTIIDDLLKEERNFFSFESILFGVGTQVNFEAAQKGMGIKHLAKIGTTADEIRKMVTFISSSVTAVSSGQGFSAPGF